MTVAEAVRDMAVGQVWRSRKTGMDFTITSIEGLKAKLYRPSHGLWAKSKTLWGKYDFVSGPRGPQ